MGEAILVAVITGVLSLIGNIISSQAAARKSEQNQAVAQAVTDTKIDMLTQEVRQHNGFAEKIPVLQSEYNELNRRVTTLEKFHIQQS